MDRLIIIEYSEFDFFLYSFFGKKTFLFIVLCAKGTLHIYTVHKHYLTQHLYLYSAEALCYISLMLQMPIAWCSPFQRQRSTLLCCRHTLSFMPAPLPSNTSCTTGACCMVITISVKRNVSHSSSATCTISVHKAFLRCINSTVSSFQVRKHSNISQRFGNKTNL